MVLPAWGRDQSWRLAGEGLSRRIEVDVDILGEDFGGIGRIEPFPGEPVDYLRDELIVRSKALDDVLSALKAAGIITTVLDRAATADLARVRVNVDALSALDNLDESIRKQAGLNHLVVVSPQEADTPSSGEGIVLVDPGPGPITELDLARKIQAELSQEPEVLVVAHQVRSESGEPLAFQDLSPGDSSTLVLAQGPDLGARSPTWPAASHWTFGVGASTTPPDTTILGQDLLLRTEPTVEPSAVGPIAAARKLSKLTSTEHPRTRARGVQRTGAGAWKAYPVLKGPTINPGTTFDLTIGIAEYRDFWITDSGALDVSSNSRLQVLLAYDPASFRIDGGPLFELDLSESKFPTRDISVEVLHINERRTPIRRIAAHFLVDGVLRGIGVRAFAVKGQGMSNKQISELLSTGPLLDLAPLVNEDPPDLLLAIYEDDSGKPNQYSWAAFPSSPKYSVPGIESTKLGTKMDDFAAVMRRSVGANASATAIDLELVGRGREIAGAIPASVRSLVKSIAESTPRRQAATVLLLTEEWNVAWELAAPDGEHALQTRFGGSSPFLGAHVAIGRWPISRDGVGHLPVSVSAARTAIFTARYRGNPTWPELPNAEKEAADLFKGLAAEQNQAVTLVEPLFDDVVHSLRANNDIVHFAMHGKFDPTGGEGGIVLIKSREKESVATEWLKPAHIDALTLSSNPFVFLNVCQVGSSFEVLGDYGGMAASFLRAGASAVVACLWSINDEVARDVSLRFYTDVFRGRSPAEIVRRLRARYASPNVATGSRSSPTLLAYQLFGHPRLHVTRQ